MRYQHPECISHEQFEADLASSLDEDGQPLTPEGYAPSDFSDVVTADSYLTRAPAESPRWPFGAMDPVQAYRAEQARKTLLAREERDRRTLADAARRDLLARLGEARL